MVDSIKSAVAAVLILSAGEAFAQHETPAVENRPPPRKASEPVKPSGSRPEPSTPPGAIPGLEDASFLVGVAGLRSEGTFLVEKRGSIIKLPTGERVFVFHAERGGKRERPMVLVSCQQLQQMEQMAADQPTVFVMTAQVFVYRGVNYALPTLVRQAGQAAVDGAPAGTSPTAEESRDGEPGVKELIKQLEAQREQPRGPEVRPLEVKAEGEPALAEGQTVSRRRGRMVRLPGGEWALAFDSGVSADTKVDRPMVLSPCLNLQRMEAWAMRAGDATSFEVSGRVLAYEGRNYLIPTMFQVCPATELEAKH